ncbi:hypothetical protein BKI52_23490 [marine bacterium AO1-C]|nr:hypothetical protein BKI52_23490 [marine bacterium AO1-C]
MKKFKDQKLPKKALQHVKGGSCNSGCTTFYARGTNSGEGDPCQFAISGCWGIISFGLCCI